MSDSMDVVESKSKIYESISIKFDPHFNDALKAVPIIKEFIKKRGLIIYGGTSMDYALRLLGDNIYPDEMLALPDLDFYSPDSVGDAYTLTKILYTAGFTSARAIVGMYVTIMKVDIVDNHFLADISYVPKKIFDTLPYIMYEGMKIIDPIFQKIDLHSCMAFPFDNAPREVIFDKWKKYIERFSKFHKYYPTPKPESGTMKLSKVDFKCKRLSSCVLDGFAAYGAILRCFKQLCKKMPDDVLPCDLLIKKSSDENVSDENVTVSVETLESTVNLVHFDTNLCASLVGCDNVEHYASFINIMPKHLRGKVGDVEFVITSTSDKLISVHRMIIDDVQVTTVGVQFLLLRFLVLAHLAGGTNRIAATYYAYYDSTMAMINHAEKIISALPEDTKNGLTANSPFFMTTKVFGKSNVSSSHKLSIARIRADMKIEDEKKQSSIPNVPRGYYAARGQPTEMFDYESSSYFIKDGRKLEHEEL